MAAIFVVAGVLHFVIPDQYAAIMPTWLPWHRGLVLVSGVAEIAGGVGLLVPRLRRAAGIGLVLLLVAVAPANWQMYLNAHASGASTLAQTLFLLRMPLQLALIGWVWAAAGLRRR
ncbi:DoxX family protein [Longimicrobium sp.]|uniref:DoxX family protein n=1 Tax=Longimicrobium sp. TaxID=2029185 RepID=UPI0032C2410C